MSCGITEYCAESAVAAMVIPTPTPNPIGINPIISPPIGINHAKVHGGVDCEILKRGIKPASIVQRVGREPIN